MKALLTYIICCFILNITCISQVPFTCKGQYYLSLTKGGSTSSGLYEVKISTNGQSIYLDTISSSIGLVLNGMGYRITDNFIYGMDPVSAELRKIGSDGIAINLGIPKDIPLDPLYYAGDVTPDGKFLILIGLGLDSPQIVKIDLDSPVYQCSFVPLSNRSVGIVDIAFDPFTGVLYGHDVNSKRLVTINPETGDINSNFTVQPQVDQLGAVFFDSFGNLYGYGSYGTLAQDKFVSINKQTGSISLLSQGPISNGQDGCACPYTLELQKTVLPDTTFPCTEVVYSFIISNGSGIDRAGIQLTDTMPEVLMAKKVIKNPFGGNVQLNGNKISITDMKVKVGIDTIKVLVEVAFNALGLYRNQAVLAGLPLALGSFTKSDNPYTFIEQDSTDLHVIPFDISFVEEDYFTCLGDSVFIDATLHGIQYHWSDGDTLAKKWLYSPSDQTLTASSLCEIRKVNIEVSSDFISLNISEDTIYTDLGNTVLLESKYSNIDDQVLFVWKSEVNPLPVCPDCQNTSVVPLFDGYYYLQMTNEFGCMVMDSVFIRVKKERTIFAPNIFSPNQDSSNDIFNLFGNSGAGMGEYIRIYDRWGNLVFESTNFEFNNTDYGWNGSFKGQPVVNGVYSWVASIIYIDGFRQIQKGDVTVVR